MGCASSRTDVSQQPQRLPGTTSQAAAGEMPAKERRGDVLSAGQELKDGHWPISPDVRTNASSSPLHKDPIIFSAPLIDADGVIYISSENWCVVDVDLDLDSCAEGSRLTPYLHTMRTTYNMHNTHFTHNPQVHLRVQSRCEHEVEELRLLLVG